MDRDNVLYVMKRNMFSFVIVTISGGLFLSCFIFIFLLQFDFMYYWQLADVAE